jgi:NTP pyrophosphatase (non-canonical NTP hydrolase)
MTFKEYQDQARKTAIYPASHAIIYPALGLSGESGEVAEKVKKWVRDGNLDGLGIAKELGDVLWYIAAIAGDLDLDLDEIAEMNIQKLSDRASRGKIQGSGDNR